MNQTIVAPKTEASTTKAYVMKITLVAALGGLLFGYDTAVIAGAIGFLQIKFNLSPTMTGWDSMQCNMGMRNRSYVCRVFK
ncbi:MAG: hypothetical protein WKG06_09980 [Segetibacter sp.]